MAYNKTVSKTIDLKTRYLELAIFPCSHAESACMLAEVVDEVFDCCYYLISWNIKLPIASLFIPVISGRYVSKACL